MKTKSSSPVYAAPNDKLYDRLVRSGRRRTVGIIIRNNAEVHIHAPAWLSTVEIERMVRSRQDWIARKRREMLASHHTSDPPSDAILYRGHDHPLLYRKDAQAPIYLEESSGLIIADDYRERRDNLIASWLRFRAESYLTARVTELAQRHGFRIGKVKVADTSSQWGSCAANGNLSLCWRLIMSPDHVSDYVILHELAHLRHLNHSPSFWQLVATLCPDYQLGRQWLRRHSRRLRRQP